MYQTADDDYSTVYGSDLGIALPAIGGAISAIGGIFGGGKDDSRYAANKDAYNLALSSPLSIFKDQGMQPTAFLLMKSPTANGGRGGWATAATQKDAYSKYTSAKSTLTGRGYAFMADGSVTPPASPGAYAPAAGPAPSGAYPPVAPPSFGGPVVAGLSTGPLLLAGAAVVAVVALSRRR